MRYHTAAHVICGVLFNEAKAKITGNDLRLEKGRIDFNLENYDREKLIEYFDKANQIIEKDLPIKIYTMPREEALNNPDMFKLVKSFPESIKQIRIVEIVGFDKQPDGGPHVKSLKEVGKLEFLKSENKGKNNRRVYFKVD